MHIVPLKNPRHMADFKINIYHMDIVFQRVDCKVQMLRRHAALSDQPLCFLYCPPAADAVVHYKHFSSLFHTLDPSLAFPCIPSAQRAFFHIAVDIRIWKV